MLETQLMNSPQLRQAMVDYMSSPHFLKFDATYDEPVVDFFFQDETVKSAITNVRSSYFTINFAYEDISYAVEEALPGAECDVYDHIMSYVTSIISPEVIVLRNVFSARSSWSIDRIFTSNLRLELVYDVDLDTFGWVCIWKRCLIYDRYRRTLEISAVHRILNGGVMASEMFKRYSGFRRRKARSTPMLRRRFISFNK